MADWLSVFGVVTYMATREICDGESAPFQLPQPPKQKILRDKQKKKFRDLKASKAIKYINQKKIIKVREEELENPGNKNLQIEGFGPYNHNHAYSSKHHNTPHDQLPHLASPIRS